MVRPVLLRTPGMSATLDLHGLAPEAGLYVRSDAPGLGPGPRIPRGEEDWGHRTQDRAAWADHGAGRDDKGPTKTRSGRRVPGWAGGVEASQSARLVLDAAPSPLPTRRDVEVPGSR